MKLRHEGRTYRLRRDADCGDCGLFGFACEQIPGAFSCLKGGRVWRETLWSRFRRAYAAEVELDGKDGRI